MTTKAELMRLDIERKIALYDGIDFVIPYSHISTAFPSDQFDTQRPTTNIIDKELLFSWAEARGWSVCIADDMSANDGFSPVRFTRIAP